MKPKQYKVTFQPQGRSVYVLAGTKVIEAAAVAGIVVNTPCGGSGICGKCKIRIVKGSDSPTDADKGFFKADELEQNWRLACQNFINTDCVIEVPQSSQLAGGGVIQTDSATSASEVLPSIRKIYVELSAPDMHDAAADLLRLQRITGKCKMQLSQIRQLPEILRQNNFKGTAIMADHHLIGFEPGDTTDKCFGIACDIGTTTVVTALYDLTDGTEVAVVSTMNPQISFGDDVISRITHSGSCDTCLADMHDMIINEINQMIGQLCEKTKVAPSDIYEIAFAGNTTMEHLLCGIDPSALGQMPFVPAYSRALVLDAVDLKIAINPSGVIYVFPIIGGFVGGDTVAGIVAADLANHSDTVIMVDIGTNGEIVLAHNGKLSAASAAAGPAFEGARISCGMRAMNGAIEKVKFSDDCICSTIGNVKPVGICGSGLIDAAAEMLRAGIIAPQGKLLGHDEVPAELPTALKKRLIKEDDGQYSFAVAADVKLTQKDIREMQLAIGAIRAGINIMLKKAGIEITQLKRVLLAGGFGSFIRRDNAQRIGLLPGGIAHDKISYIGNASLAGARLSLLSSNIRRKAEETALIVDHIELSLDMGFQNEFAEAMMFPEE